MAHPQTPPTFNPVITGSDEYSVELNDANITAKAWKSSRYDGSKTETAVLNQYSEGDISVGKTTAVQKYSRNIYLGNGVIGMDENGGEDNSLVNLPNFSYITTLKYITVNGDNTISTDIVESKPDDFNSRRGFYRSFYEDFPVKSSCKIIVNDISIKTNLKDNYNIFFNGGQLQKLVHLQTPIGGGSSGDAAYITYLTSSATNGGIYPFATTFDNNKGAGYIIGVGPNTNINDAVSFHTASFYNQEIYSTWFTGSITKTITLGGKDGGSNTLDGLNFGEFYNFGVNFFNYKNTSTYNGDKRMFITFAGEHSKEELISGINKQPIYTPFTGSYPEGSSGIITNKLNELSTYEVGSIENSNASSIHQIAFNEARIQGEKTLGFNYTTQTSSAYYNSQPPNSLPANFTTGSMIFSKTEDATPSLLVKLSKNTHLPDGIGRNGFVIIPDNLHPHVKKNLIHFLAKAGVSLDLDTIPALDTTFERLS